MASDTDWVEDVRRWYFNGGQAKAKRAARQAPIVTAHSVAVDPASELGYEAAQPNLQAQTWGDTAAAGLTELR